MSRIGLGGICRTLGALALVCASTASVAGPPAGSRKVLLVVREGSNNIDLMLPKELVVMIDTLKTAGLEPVVASLSGGDFVSRTATVKSDLKLADVRVSDYAAVVLPCMAAGEPGVIPDLAVRIVTDAAAAGKPIAAQRAGLHILSRAGLLKGKTYAYLSNDFPEGTRGHDPVVRDGNIITAAVCPNAVQSTGLPDTTVPLINKLVETLG